MIEQYMGTGWYNAMLPLLQSSYFQSLREFLNRETKLYRLFPSYEVIFKAFKETPLETVRVVILGQDPYHDGSATGLAFANAKISLSPSLRNIMKEVKRDIYNDAPNFKFDSSLESWAKQGVLLLNTALSVRYRDAGSHMQSWMPFTNYVLGVLGKQSPNIIYLLWGKHASNFKHMIKSNYILEAGHPSPLNTSTPFVGCGHFSKVNEILKELNEAPIIW